MISVKWIINPHETNYGAFESEREKEIDIVDVVIACVDVCAVYIDINGMWNNFPFSIDVEWKMCVRKVGTHTYQCIFCLF